MALRTVGGDPTVSGRFLGRTFFLTNGWRIQPAEEHAEVTIGGNFFVDGGGNPFNATVGNYNVQIYRDFSNLVDVAVSELSTIQKIAFQGEYGAGVYIDKINGTAGTDFPVGTLGTPCINTNDANTIADANGFNIFYIRGNITLSGVDDVTDRILIGQGATDTTITVLAAADTAGVKVRQARVTGEFDTTATFSHLCHLQDIDFVEADIHDCVLEGTITLSGTGTTSIYNCWDGKAGGSGTYPVFDFGGSGRGLIVRNFAGDLEFQNKTGSERIEVNNHNGRIVIGSDVTDGIITLEGRILIENNSTGTTVVDTSQVEYPEFAQLAAFGGVVYIDTVNGMNDTAFPAGTAKQPVKTLAEALTVAGIWNLGVIFFLGDLTIGASDDISNLLVRSSGFENTLTLTAGCVTENSKFTYCELTGQVNGYVTAERCLLNGLTNLGSPNNITIFDDCKIMANTYSFRNDVTMGNAKSVDFRRCTSGVPGTGTFALDLNGSWTPVEVRGYIGGISVDNLTQNSSYSFDIDVGRLVLNATCTAVSPSFVVRGVLLYVNNSAFTASQELIVDPAVISAYVWNADIGGATYESDTSKAGTMLNQLNLVMTSKLLVDDDAGQSKLIIYRRDGVTPLYEWTLQDKDGNDIVLQGTGPVDRAIMSWLNP